MWCHGEALLSENDPSNWNKIGDMNEFVWTILEVVKLKLL